MATTTSVAQPRVYQWDFGITTRENHSTCCYHSSSIDFRGGSL